MASGDDGPPLSLRPYPVADRKPKNLAELIARINAQPGGFRAVSEAKLLDEIRLRDENNQNGETADDDVDMSEGGDDEDDEDAARDLNEAHMDVLRNIDIAGNTALLTLDFLSLLLSKQNPTQASVTLSQGLRDMVGIGTMGADKLDDSNVTPAKVKEQEEVAIGWTLMEINKTRDAAEAASSFLQREIAAEGKYWEEIVAVQKGGWSISKVPQERHSLGVRFGFSEAALEFRSNGLAPMRRGIDGAVQLDLGRLGGVSERLVVTYEKDGQVTGRSALPAHTTSDAPLEARVLEARNTIFSQELWHELTREARTLAAYDVKPNGSRLTCVVDPTTKITVELVPLGSQPSGDDLPDNNMAETISLALHILLSHAHRHNELMRTRPMPAHIPRNRGQQTCALLRPIIARLMHIRNVHACTKHIGALIQSLQKASVPASFTLHTASSLPSEMDAATRGPNQPSASQTLIRNALQPIEFNTKVTLSPDITLTVRGRTFLFPVTATLYYVILPPASPLASICAPYKEGYPDLKALADYLRTATARVLTEHFLDKLPAPPSGSGWVKTVGGTSIIDVEKEDFELSFGVVNVNDAPSLLVASSSIVDGRPSSNRWTWSADPASTSEPASLQDVVSRVINQALS
ncbi:subunit 17 of mediator complex-domain-containing protein [Dactylonectria estremocensis]|uniref:Mediator of RNA polymerase II transcription subunit 17 n=1 Tax=Dactylonectria estremocensis TaxID=1079267 RepID=A0A9P9FCN8_9HYPO|nr:subunit 17 of mediator complex-domain-containing protein [Dactylonectria estremocensis]